MIRILPTLLALTIAAAPAAALPPNPYVERMNAMSDAQRRAVLRGAIVNYGQRCGRVGPAQFRGTLKNLTMWSIRCAPGGDYGVFVGPDGTAQVRSCEDLARLHLPTCRLPLEPAASPASRGRRGG